MPTFAIATLPGASTVDCPADANIEPAGPGVVTDICNNVLTAVVHNDGPLTCEGDVIWTFTYTDCAGNIVDWTHTITIDILPFTLPIDDGSTVNCPVDAQVQPTPPVMDDMCGNAITPTVVVPALGGCTGVGVDWVFTYTDCAGNTADWTYTYTITYLHLHYLLMKQVRLTA